MGRKKRVGLTLVWRGKGAVEGQSTSVQNKNCVPHRTAGINVQYLILSHCT